MNVLPVLLVVGALPLLAGCAGTRPPPDAAGGQAVARTAPSAGFGDTGRGASALERVREAELAELRTWLSGAAARRLPAGQRLEIRLTDLDRAGRLEPWQRGAGTELRVVRSVTPPRIDLDFRLLAADGGVLREGSRRLRDAGFEWSTGARNPTDRWRHEKALLERWLDREFRAKAG